MASKKFKRTSFIWLGILLGGLILLAALGGSTKPAFAYPLAQQTLTAPWYAVDMAPISWTNPKQTKIFVFDSVSSYAWQNTLSGTTPTWSGWTIAGANSTTVRFRTINGVVSKPNTADIFMVDRDKNVWHKIYNSTGTHPPGFQWESLGAIGGTYQQSVQAVSWGSGRIDLFRSKMETGEPFLHKWSPSGVFGEWSPSATTWETIGTGPLDVYATTWGVNRIDVVAKDGTNNVVHKWFDGSSWQPSQNGWNSLGMTTSSKPFALSWGANRLDVFIRGGTPSAPSQTIYQKTWNGTTWSSWKNLGGGSTYDNVTGVSWGSGRMDIFESRSDGVYHKAFRKGVWVPSTTGWDYLGGGSFSTLSVTSWGANRLDLFGARGSDGTLWHLAWDGTNWVPDINAWELLNEHPNISPTPTSRLP